MTFKRWWNDPKVPTAWETGNEKAAARAAWEAATKAEREACAVVCEDYAREAWDIEGGALGCAERTRARAQEAT